MGKTWNIWVLSEEDITHVLDQFVEKKELSPEQVEEVVRTFKKGVEALLGDGNYSWVDILKEAIVVATE